MTDWLDEIVITAPRVDGWSYTTFDWHFQDESDYLNDGGGFVTYQDVKDNGQPEVTITTPEGVKFVIFKNEFDNVEFGTILKVLAEAFKVPSFQLQMQQLAGKNISFVFRSSTEGPLDIAGNVVVTWSERVSEPGGVIAAINSTTYDANGDAINNQQVVITFNDNLNRTYPDFAKTVIHEILHTTMGFQDADGDGRIDDSFHQLIDDTAVDFRDTIVGPDTTIDNWQHYLNSGFAKAAQDAANLHGEGAKDNLTGGSGDDQLYGKNGNDILEGGAGADTLYGGNGFDILISDGNSGDRMYGGYGADYYVVNNALRGAIGDQNGSGDWLQINATSSVSFDQSGNALQIIDQNTGNTLSVYNWFGGQEIEIVALSNGNLFASQIINQIVATQNYGQTESGGGLLPPIVFDLDGDGIELIDMDDTKTKIDLDDDGKKDKTGWVSADDGILVYDQNGNGKVDGHHEFTFNQFGKDSKTDLEGLAEFDDNGDGLITNEDAIWSDLLIWQDANSNGKSSPKELISLEDIGITSISLKSDGEMHTVEENVVFGTADFTWADGSVGTLGDVALRTEIFGYEWHAYSELYYLASQGVDQGLG